MKRVTLVLAAWLCLILPAAAETPRRIVSLAPNVTEILYDLGLGDNVVAVSRYCNYPAAVREKPRIGGLTNPSLEAIVALKPDLVILTDDGNPQSIADRLRRLGIALYVFQAKRLDDLTPQIRKLGAFLEATAAAARSAGRIEAALGRYRARARAAGGKIPTKVLFVVQPEPLMVVGTDTAIDDCFRLLGLHNVAAEAGPGYPRYSLEEVIRQAPDILFIGQGHMVDMAAQSRPLLRRLRQLPCVRQNRVYYVGDPLFRMGPRIVEGIADLYRWSDRRN
jgi:iron complex transport system substrate-binding protein